MLKFRYDRRNRPRHFVLHQRRHESHVLGARQRFLANGPFPSILQASESVTCFSDFGPMKSLKTLTLNILDRIPLIVVRVSSGMYVLKSLPTVRAGEEWYTRTFRVLGTQRAVSEDRHTNIVTHVLEKIFCLFVGARVFGRSLSSLRNCRSFALCKRFIKLLQCLCSVC